MQIEEIISTDKLYRLRSTSKSYGLRYKKVQHSETMLSALLEFAKVRFGKLSSATVHDVTLSIHHSNSWTIMSDRLVLRLGDTVRLDVAQERYCWEIGRLCAAVTPHLIEMGNFAGQPYMIYGLISGCPVMSGRLPPQAGHFLRHLHSVVVPGQAYPLHGNWPTRRNTRYITALTFAEQRFGSGAPIVHAIRRATPDTDTTERGMVLNHGDFRTANMLVTPDQELAVLDWTDAHLGTREEDIGGCDPADIPGLITHYCSEGCVVLDTDLVVGHAFARVLSLVAHQVLPETVIDTTYRILSPLLTGP